MVYKCDKCFNDFLDQQSHLSCDIKYNKNELISLCKERNIKSYSNKNKNELILLLLSKTTKESITESDKTTKESITESDKLKMIDLFAGTGAFTLAFEKTKKVECIFANDMEECSKKIYDENFNHKLLLKNLNDIKVEDIPKHDILTGGFPCFIKGTKVLTDDGYKNIEDVDLIHKLLTHTGKFQNILNFQRKYYTGDLYDISVKCNPTIITCTKEHPFYVRENKYKNPIWKNANELTMNDYFGMVINTNNIMPKLLYHEIKHYIDNEKYIPECIQDAPIDYINKFINTFFTKDTTSSYKIALGLQRLYLKLGFIYDITIIDDVYHIKLQTNNNAFIDNNYVWYAPSYIIKKYKSDVLVYNFEVETDNSYIVENICVHNCQGFSIAGKQKGFDDERSNVFWKILSIIDYHNPKCIILENVKNILSHDDGKTFEIIKQNLIAKNYHICYKVLNTSDITGIPQHRERIYIVGFKSKDIFDKFNLNFDTIKKESISTILEQSVNSKYYYTDKSSTWKIIKDSIVKKNTIYQYRRVYVRENKSNECFTLTANMGTGGHNVPLILDDNGIRKLSPRECFNLQGFPSSYKLPNLSDSSLYKLAGNAVSVPVVNLIAQRITTIMGNSPHTRNSYL